MEFVSWDYCSQLNGKIKFMFQTTNQIQIVCSTNDVAFGFTNARYSRMWQTSFFCHLAFGDITVHHTVIRSVIGDVVFIIIIGYPRL